MLQQIFMALGAGVASALLFIVPVKGSMFAVVIGVIAPLPLLIAALGYGLMAGLAALAIGGALIAIALHPIVALVYLISVAGPALLLSWQASRPRLGEPDCLLASIVALATAISAIGVASLALHYSTFDSAVDDLSTRFTPIVTAVFNSTEAIPGGFDPREFARWIVLGMAPVAAGWGVIAFAGNLWLAARITQISGLLKRPWPDMPTTLGLPKAALFVLAAVLGLCVAPGVTRILASSATAALMVAFALQGLATLHALTRGKQTRIAILASIYALTLALFPWPLIVAAGLGVTDLARSLRQRLASPVPTPKKTDR